MNKVDKTYQGSNFHQKNIFFVKTYLKSPTSSPMRFLHFKCVKYALYLKPCGQFLSKVPDTTSQWLK
jgi:hypothetical protein